MVGDAMTSRTEHFHVVTEVVPPRWEGLPDRYRAAGRTKSAATTVARIEQQHLIPGHEKNIVLERCSPPCQYDYDNWPYGGTKLPSDKGSGYRAGSGWIEYEDAK